MDLYTKYIIQNHLYWIENGFTKEDIRKIHNEVWDEHIFDNVTMKRIQKKKGYTLTQKEIIEASDFDKITFLYLDYAEHILDLSFLKYCTNLEEIKMPFQKLKNLEALTNLEKIRKIDASYNDIENIDCLYAMSNLEELKIESNPIESLHAIKHLKKLNKIKIDTIKDENEIFKILKNSNSCSINYILEGGNIDFENLIFPKYLVNISKKENLISLVLEARTHDNDLNSTIYFPEGLANDDHFIDYYIEKIKQMTTERLEKILGNSFEINKSKLLRYVDLFSFQYEHDIT
jgi:hypothetical protein